MEGEGAGSEGAPGSAPASPFPLSLSSDELGEPDCVLEGQGWSIPVHRCAVQWCLPPSPPALRQPGLWVCVRVGCGVGELVFTLTQLLTAPLPQNMFKVHSSQPPGPPCVCLSPCPVHRAVLRQRCDHFRARCGAGWADAASAKVSVPDHFSRQAVASFLHYCYNGGCGCGCGWG